MAKVWEVGARPGPVGSDWRNVLFTSKAKAWAQCVDWLKEGYTIRGPNGRRVI